MTPRIQKQKMDTTTTSAEEQEEQRHDGEVAALESAIAEAEGVGSAAASSSSGVGKSYRCVATGKLLRSVRDMELYAERTGHTDFEETDIEVPKLTPEEKAQKVKDLQALLKKKREEREENEKQTAISAERKRREEGKSHGEVREELAKIQRDREYEARKKEKARFNAEREKLKLEVAKDKAERAAEKARREGRDPKVAYDEALSKALGLDKPTTADSVAVLTLEKRLQMMDKSLEVLSTFRTGGDGLKAQQTLRTMINNVLKSPDEPKFRKINLLNEAFKKKVSQFAGSLDFLHACGFGKVEAGEEKFLSLNEVDAELLKTALLKLDASIAKMS